MFLLSSYKTLLLNPDGSQVSLVVFLQVGSEIKQKQISPPNFSRCPESVELSVFLLSAGGCLASELAFLLEPSDVTAVRDRPLMLDCRVQGEEPIMVTWRRNGVPLPSSPRVQVLANGTLLIQSFQKRREGSDADTGEYECAAQNRYGMLVSRRARVQLACK